MGDVAWEEVEVIHGAVAAAMPPSLAAAGLGTPGEDLRISPPDVDWGHTTPDALDAVGAFDEELNSDDSVSESDLVAGGDDDGSEYERQRAANIRENERVLQELGLAGGGCSLKPPPKRRTHRKRKAVDDPPCPGRTREELGLRPRREPPCTVDALYASGAIVNPDAVKSGRALPSLGSAFAHWPARSEPRPRPPRSEPRSRSRVSRYGADPKVVAFVKETIRPLAQKSNKITRRMKRVAEYVRANKIPIEKVTPRFLYRFLAIEALGRLNIGAIPDKASFVAERVFEKPSKGVSTGLFFEDGFYSDDSLFAYTTEWAVTLLILEPDDTWAIDADPHTGQLVFKHSHKFRDIPISVIILGFPRLSMRAGKAASKLFPDPTEAGKVYARNLYDRPEGRFVQEAPVYQIRSKMKEHFEPGLAPPPIVAEAIKCLHSLLT